MYFLNRFQVFDIYAKPVDDCRIKTSFGGLITLLCFIVIALLFISEIAAFFYVEISEQLFVDSTSSDIKIDINFDITFPKLSCDVSVDVVGLGVEEKNDINKNIMKQQLDKDGNIIKNTITNQSLRKTNTQQNQTVYNVTIKCGSCYGAIKGCCNTCKDVKEAYQLRNWQIFNISEIIQCKNEEIVKASVEKKEQGCRLYGRVNVGKVSGNLHITPGHLNNKQNAHFYDHNNLISSKFDSSHTFNHFSFGKTFPGKQYPLDEKSFINKKESIMHQYYLKVVPTTYVYSVTSNNQEDISYQFSITRREKDLSFSIDGIPGVFIFYEFSPLMVHYQEKRKSFTNFAVSLCAIIGGVFTVASLIDSFIYSGACAVQKKFQIGKFN